MSQTSHPHFPAEPWRVTEATFDPAQYRTHEGVLALANGYMGQRASFEEGLPGVESLRGAYVAGLFDHYPNATMIKLKGRPTHPSEMVVIPDFLSLRIRVDGIPVELRSATVETYTRALQMDRGVLTRAFTCRLPDGPRVRVAYTRFLSRTHRHLAAMQVSVTLLDAAGTVEFTSEVDGSVRNLSHVHLGGVAVQGGEVWHGVSARTCGTGIDLVVLAHERVDLPAMTQHIAAGEISRWVITLQAQPGQPVVLEKVVAVATGRDCDVQGSVADAAACFLTAGVALGFAGLLAAQETAWAEVWRTLAIEVKDKSGTDTLTQGLRYSLYQMVQNAPNGDHTVNIGAKGLTGEHYFGTYFWDTEVFMLPMFAFCMPEVARDLVRFRAHTLPGARHKAQGEMDLAGAAYPFMSDDTGSECATLWQFGLMGVHVTAAVGWSVWFTYCTTGDLDLVADGGIDIIVETARFWTSRVFYRADIDRYAINRVLGPDEYHQGVDNNFYTNIMAQENLDKACRLLDILHAERPEAYLDAVTRLGLTDDEIAHLRRVGELMYLPYHDELCVNLQDDRFHRLQPYDLQAQPLPGAINALWSYDRIMRTQLLRQGDVVVAHVLLGNRFTPEQMRRDFAYYEPKTTHDSSLSFCHHSVIAAALKDEAMAYDYYLRTARLDLDDIHGNAWQGVHTACLAGAWQCVVLGFGGVRWHEGVLALDPLLPAQWDAFSFSIHWHGTRVSVTVEDGAVRLATDGAPLTARLGADIIIIGPQEARHPYPTRPAVA